MLVRRGGKVHKLWGKIFSISMITSSLISLLIASFPGHENMFLFLIGIFTIYMVLGIICFLKDNNLWKLYFFFGSIGLFMTYRDFKSFKKFPTNNKVAVVSHVGRMVGAFITSVTAFIVAGLSISNLVVWLLPTLLGIPYIIFWTRKMKTIKI